MSNLWRWRKKVVISLGGLVGATIALSAFILLFRILWAPTEIGTPVTESDALIRANERMLDMTKWTISTILLIGGGLIGLNWYSNEHRYRDDRAELDGRLDRSEKERLSELTSSMQERLDLRKQLLEVQLDVFRLTDQITNMMLFPDGQMPPGGYVLATIELLGKPGITEPIKKRALESIALMFEAVEKPTHFTVWSRLDKLPELADVAEAQGFQEHAARLRTRHTVLTQLLGDDQR